MGQNIARTAWALAPIQFAPRGWAATETPWRDTLDAMPPFPQELKNTAWAMSVLVFEHGRVLHAIASRVGEQATACEGQHLANPAWSYSALLFGHRLCVMLYQQIPTVGACGPRGLRSSQGSLPRHHGH